VVADEFPSLGIYVDILPDGLVAMMRIERIPGARYRLEDQPSAPSVTLRRLLAERIPCPEPTREELDAALAAHGVVFGIDPEVLGRFTAGEIGPLAVARGTARVASVTGRTRLAGTVDAAGERFVRAGTVLAHVEPGQAGAPGRSVTGEVLELVAPRTPEVAFGEGTTVEDDGRVVAAIDGHARFAAGELVVTPALQLPMVRGRDGDVTTPGSVDVAGSIEDDARVRARRSVVVADQVRGSTVEAGFSLVIHGAAFDSKLMAGHTVAALRRLAGLVAPLGPEVARLHAAVGQLIAATRASDRELHPIRALAMASERIAPELDTHVKAALAEADRERGTVPHHVLAALRGAYEDLDLIRTGRLPVDALSTVADAFAGEASRLQELTAATAELQVGLLQKCEVDVIGAVRVTGKGIVDSLIRVRGSLDMEGAEAIFRGGRLEIDGDAIVSELAAGGRGLEIELAPGSTLRARAVQPGVVFHLPDGTRRVSILLSDVFISADEEAA
jgi:hypothetical protein